MRALFRPFALHAAYTPIETIVFFCIIGTLAYFHILSAIKHSAFIDPAHTLYAAPLLKPAHALWRVGEWVGVREGTWSYAAKGKGESDDVVLELQQVVVTLEGVGSRKPTGLEVGTLCLFYLKAQLIHCINTISFPQEYQPSISLSQAPLSGSTVNLTQYLTNAFQTSSGRTYPALCHRPLLNSLNHSDERSEKSTPEHTAAEYGYGPCFTFQQAGSRSFVQTLSFKSGLRDEFVNALLGEDTPSASGPVQQQNHHGISTTASSATPRVFTDESGIRFEVDAGRLAPDSLPIGQMRNGKWVAYAARALVIRFWDLAKVCF